MMYASLTFVFPDSAEMATEAHGNSFLIVGQDFLRTRVGLT